ncbi:NB-ARC domains-containing protein [Tanacetum coccineum]
MNLRKLKVLFCKNLVSLGEKDEEEEYNNGEEGGEKNMGKSMPISDHPNVVGFGDGLWPPNLRELTIGNLKKPISEWGPQKFPSTLVDLRLYGDKEEATNWSQLSHLHLPSSLTRLEINGFEKLETVSDGLQDLTSLQHLVISWCPKIEDLPETLLPSLLSLEIVNCPNLQYPQNLYTMKVCSLYAFSLLSFITRQTSLGNVNTYMEQKILMHRLCNLRVRTCKAECSTARLDHDRI